MTDRGYVEAAKMRVAAYGLDPNKVPAFEDRMTESELDAKRREYDDVLVIIRFFVGKLLGLLGGLPVLVVTSDEAGYVLEVSGDPSIKTVVDSLGIRPGARFTEEECGSNVINLALMEHKPVRLVGPEHYHTFLHGVACYAVPLQDLRYGNTLGTLSIMTMLDGANEHLLAVLVTAADSIERELLLRHHNAKLHILSQIIIASTTNGVIIVDERGVIQELNDASAKCLGIEREAFIGVHVGALPLIGDHMVQVVREQQWFENVEIEFDHPLSQGTRVCTFQGDPILDHNQNLLGAVAQVRDITDKLRTEQVFLQAEKLSVVARLGAALAHEIRNPLTTIKGFIQLMSSEPATKSKHFSIILSELKRIEDIIEEFLNTASPRTFEYRECDVRALIAASVGLMQPVATIQGVEIIWFNTSSEWVVYADESKLKQVLVNLLKNALESMTKPGRITIQTSLSIDGTEVLIRIADEGSGIPPEVLAKLGTPFYTTKEKGTGLGLTVCANIVRQHHGTMNFHSELNNGTTVTLSLPIHTSGASN